MKKDRHRHFWINSFQANRDNESILQVCGNFRVLGLKAMDQILARLRALSFPGRAVEIDLTRMGGIEPREFRVLVWKAAQLANEVRNFEIFWVCSDQAQVTEITNIALSYFEATFREAEYFNLTAPTMFPGASLIGIKD